MHKLFLILNGIFCGSNLSFAFDSALAGQPAWAGVNLLVGIANLVMTILLANQAYEVRHA